MKPWARWAFFFSACFFFSGRAGAQNAPIKFEPPEPMERFLRSTASKTPAEALQTFEVAQGFSLELIAHEPLVVDPVAAAIDENGLMYVCEFRDYPYRPDEIEKPLGRVRLLEDADGDGVYDRSHVFADGLSWAAGVAPFKGGVYVSAPPDIWYLKDADGDRHAEIRRKIFTGFGVRGSQSILNNLKWGIDHRIYASVASNGGEVVPAGDPDAEPISLRSRDARFDPVGGRIEAISGGAQFGNTFDDWGNRFICNQQTGLFHVMLPLRYLRRNPHVAYPRSKYAALDTPTPIFRISPLEAWRIVRTSRRLVARERDKDATGASHNMLDSVAGSTVYRGDAFGEEFRDTVFIGEAQHNLVHRRRLYRDGLVFKSRRMDPKTEFIRSSDNWFRPVNFVNAPDGTLYILDLSREIIESIHIPLDVVEHLDLTRGRDQGRIYRIKPKNFDPPPPPRLGAFSTRELVDLLESPNGWLRETAHRLLFERQDRSAETPIRSLLHKSRSPKGRIHALWSLEGLGALKDEDLAAALEDDHPRVREHAVRLAESRMGQSPELLDAILALADDPDDPVRFQVAFTLGETSDPRAIQALVRIAKAEPIDRGFRAAVLSSCADRADRLIAELLGDPAFASIGKGINLSKQLARTVGARNKPAEIERLIGAISFETNPELNPATRRIIVIGLGEGLRRCDLDLERIEAKLPPPMARTIERQLAEAIEILAHRDSSSKERRAAVRLVGLGGFERAEKPLRELLSPQISIDEQLKAIDALSRFSHPRIVEALLGHWRAAEPKVRREILGALLEREQRIGPLLDAVETGAIKPSEIDAATKNLLKDHDNPDIARRAKTLFTPSSASRLEAIERYQPALELEGDPKRGEAVYERLCSSCHQLGAKGHDIGPNLYMLGRRDRAELLVHILDPNLKADPAYLQYAVRLKNGETVSGIIVAESADSLTLRNQTAETIVARADIVELRGGSLSLMPEGLEEGVSLREMADLLALLAFIQYDVGTTKEWFIGRNPEAADRDVPMDQ